MDTEFEVSSSGDADVVMSLQTHQLDGAVYIYARGELDFASAATLSSALEATRPDGPRRVVLDLTGLTFCDAGGVTALLRAHRALRDGGGHLLIRGASGLPRRVLALTGVDGSLNLE
jgi:anti-sigma B factor antagonist